MEVPEMVLVAVVEPGSSAVSEILRCATERTKRLTNPSRLDVHTKSPDVENGSVVGERSLDVGRVDGTNGVGGGDTGRAGSASINVRVACRDGEVKATGNSGGNSRVHGSVGRSTQAGTSRCQAQS